MISFIRLQSCLTLDLAKYCLDAALQKASELNVRIGVVIVDVSGHPINTARMDGAPPQCHDIALKKAKTAVGFGISTKLWRDRLEGCSDQVKQGLPLQADLALFGGGEPIMMGDQVIGGVGISGASESIDEECAMAAALRASELLPQ